jgi:hypothetical protein
MFGHDAPTDLTARVDHLMIDVLVEDERQRLVGLRACRSPDFVYVRPDGSSTAPTGCARRSSATATTAASRPPTRRTTPVDRHHG